MFAAGEIGREEEVWTCGVDRFSQRVKKFESKAALLQTSALPPLGRGGRRLLQPNLPADWD